MRIYIFLRSFWKVSLLIQVSVLVLVLEDTRLCADMITVHNMITPTEALELSGGESDGTLYARVYYYKHIDEHLLSTDKQGIIQPIVEISAGKSQSIERPGRWQYQTFPYPKNYDRQLVFSLHKEDLVDTLSDADYQKLGAVNIGNAKGWSFYIVERDMRLEGYNALEWKVIKPLIDTKVRVEVALKHLIKKTFLVGRENAHEFDQATVRESNELCVGERDYLIARKPYVKRALEALLDTSSLDAQLPDMLVHNRPADDKKVDNVPANARTLDDEQVPIIALVASGGGYRAMLGTVGSLVGAQETGLLDIVTYVAGLSGSTWAIGGLMERDITPIELKNKLITMIDQGPTNIDSHEAQLIGEALLVKYAHSQSLTTVDVYGALLATQLFGDFQDKRHQIYLSQQVNTIKDGHVPFPLYAAARRGVGIPTTWWEFSPYEVGSAAFGEYIPSWAYGRKFYAGTSIDFAPEQSFGYNLGTFGSAFAAEFKTIYRTIIGSLDEPYKSAMSSITEFIDIKMAQDALEKFGNKRIKFSWASVHNFMRGIEDSPLQHEKELRLVDAGIDFNVPYPLVSGKNNHRMADIMIVLDYSATIIDASALRGCERYARANGLLFPEINYTDITRKAITVFKDDNNPAVPVVVYMPLVKDELLWQQYRDLSAFAPLQKYLDTFDPIECEQTGFCKTHNFTYATTQSLSLISQTEFNFKASFGVIKKVIEEWVVSRERVAIVSV